MPLIENNLIEDYIYKEFDYDNIDMYIINLNFLLNEIYNINIITKGFIYRKIELEHNK